MSSMSSVDVISRPISLRSSTFFLPSPSDRASCSAASARRRASANCDRARRTFDPERFEELEDHYHVLVANIDMIEHVGGGSTRCMLAEKF